MSTEEQNSWLGALGVDFDKAKDWASQKVDDLKDDVSKAANWVEDETQKGVDWAKTEANNVVDDVKKGADWVKGEVNKASDAVQKGADAIKMKALGDQSGKPVPRPTESDCQPQHGYVPGPKNHLLCATHGHVIDTDAGTIIAASVADYIEAGLGKIVNAAEDDAKKVLGQQPSGDPTAPPSLPKGVDPTGTLEFPFEVKGPKTSGIIKVNKAYIKPAVKISVNGAPDGDLNVGPSGGRKGGATQVGVTAEAKQTAQNMLTKKFDETVNSLVKSVTDHDGAVKTELFTKAKAEAKRDSKETSVKIGYDFGIDATVFGMGKDTIAVKFTLAGLKYKPGEKPPVQATVLAADFSDKLAIKWRKAFQLGQTLYDIEGSAELGVELEPNWAEIAKDALEEFSENAAGTAISIAIEAALVAGPPLLAGIIVGQAIYAAGERGALDAAILDGATDARQAAESYAHTMTGSEGDATGPRAQAAVALAMKQLAESAAKSNTSVDDLMTGLRNMDPKDLYQDFSRIRSQARQRIRSAYSGEIAKAIHSWRKDHYVLAAWTTEEDDCIAAEKKVDLVFGS